MPHFQILRPIWKWPARVTLAFLTFSLVFAVIGAAYQSVGYWHDSQHFPQRGHFFSVGSIKLNLNCTGEGRPTVVFDSGMGGSSLDWVRVQPEVTKFTRVCSYDRAGYGWSEPSPNPRTSLQIAKELKELLTSAAERGPYLLVGHSFGGYNIRMFNKLYPFDVAGMVLVDAEHPDEEVRQKELQSAWPEVIKARIEEEDKRRQFWNRITQPIELYLGGDRLKLTLGKSYSPNFSQEFQHELLFLEQQPKYSKAVEAEDKLDAQSAAQVRAVGDLGNKPLIVLTAEKPYAGDPNDYLLTHEQKSNRDHLWIDQLQAQYAHLSSRGKQVVVQGSSHEMPTDRQDAIVSAVHEIWSVVK